MWRYQALLPLGADWLPVSMGEGATPLVLEELNGQQVHLKLEYQLPTGSYKDRGSSVLVTALRGMGVKRVVDDSSGNAGASLAAYCAKGGIACELCVPGGVPTPKLAQMAASGADVIEIRGRREYAALAAWAAAAHGAYYASHVYSPFFQAGVETVAYEIWEQLGGKAPAALLLPVGNGVLLLSAFQGFKRLHESGMVSRMPKLLAVQAEACAPIYHAFQSGQDRVESVKPVPTLASSIAIGLPARGAEVLAAVRSTGGQVMTVTETEIERARGSLARRGFYVEATSAVTIAALPYMSDLAPDLIPEKTLVVLLTGHGLKTGWQP
jgi:threonine synthase